MIEKKQSGKHVKVYITWRIFGASPLRKVAPHLSQRINPRDKTYPNSVFTKHCEAWELKQVFNTELQLMPIRETIDSLHEAKVSFSRRVTRINRLTNKLKDNLK